MHIAVTHILGLLLLGIVHLVSAEFDSIVVGGGPSGCIVASELAAAGEKVLLLEAGPPASYVFGGRDQESSFGALEGISVIDVPGENERNRKKREYWWDTVPWGFTGRVLGGSGVMNGALTFTPSPSDFDAWPEGWKYDDMVEHFNSTFSRMSLTTTPSADRKPYLEAASMFFDQMAINQLSLTKADLNMSPGSRGNTFSEPVVSAMGGTRVDACMSFLMPALEKYPDLQLMTDAEVDFLLYNGKGMASGVQLKDGSEELLNPGGKIVLTAGVFHTPRLLMLSGIGQSVELERLNNNGLVKTKRDLWVVNEQLGKNIGDHAFSEMTFRVNDVANFTYRYAARQIDPVYDQLYQTSRSGPLAQYGPVRLGFVSRSGTGPPEIELLVVPFGEENRGPLWDCDTCFRILLMLMSPKSTMDFKIKTDDMDCNCPGCKSGDICQPDMHLNDSYDRDLQTWGLKRVGQAALDQGYTVLRPESMDDAGIENYFETHRNARLSGNHWGGTCKIGTCVDETLKVIGTENIYVADSSLFPAPVRAHNVGTVFAVAKKAAGIISASQSV